MKIDLHVHCSEYSPCARSPAEAMVEAAIRVGLDALVFTNHSRFVPPGMMEYLRARYAPFRLFNGVEKTLDGEDFLVFGVLDAELEGRAWQYDALRAFVHERDGCLVLAHPYRHPGSGTLDLAGRPPDAVECRSTNISPVNYARIHALAESLDVRTVRCSDAHAVKDVGRWHIELFGGPSDETELAMLLRESAFACGPSAAETEVMIAAAG